ncbi:MAG: cell division protein FtsW [Ruminococcus sp.]|nr:cell division protein FtsW [Ruminococcus sp.]
MPANGGLHRERDGGLVYNNHIPVIKRQPVAQARKKLNFHFIRSGIDKPFLVLVLVLLVFGVIMMFSASFAWGLNDKGDGYYYAKRQIVWAGIGLVIMLVASLLDYHFFQNTTVCYTFFIIMYGVTWYAAIFGSSTADASRWINLGPMQFQPSELLKVSFIIIFAYIMAVNFPKFDNWRYCIIPFTVIMGLVVLVLVVQRHLSAVLIIGIIGVSMMFVSGMPRGTFWKFIGVLAAGAALFVLLVIVKGSGFSYITDRIESWRNPTSDPQDTTYQTYNSLLAIGSGGWTGLGFGESRQKYLYLPEAQNDFVFSVICEELGFVGAVVIIMLFVIFVLRGFYIASNAKDRFGMLVAAGITIQIGIQAFLNIMVASNAFPNTGISLPFFSYGGTALVIQLAEMGILLNISRQGNINK